MTKATALNPVPIGSVPCFTDPSDNSTVFVNKVETKQADGKPPKNLKGANPASAEQLAKLAAHFKNGIPAGQIAVIGSGTRKK